MKLLIVLVLFRLMSAHAETLEETAAESPHTPDIVEYQTMLGNKYSLFIHKRNYVLPYSYVWNPSTDLYTGVKNIQDGNGKNFYSHHEAEFQISFFVPVYRKIAKSNWDLLVAYTHHAWWQVYNNHWSRPFRETNYNPEVFFRNTGNPNRRFLGLNFAGFDLGVMHQSNGQIQQLSRSWDRAFFRGFLMTDDFSLSLALWARIPSDRNDDNPRTKRYLGIGELELQKSFGRLTLETRAPISRRSGVELAVSYPWRENMRWFVSGHYGYGQSLIEYDRSTKRVGVGIALDNFMDKHKR